MKTDQLRDNEKDIHQMGEQHERPPLSELHVHVDKQLHHLNGAPYDGDGHDGGGHDGGDHDGGGPFSSTV